MKGRYDWRGVVKKLRYYIAATIILLAAGVVFALFLRRVLLQNYQTLETSVAHNYAAEVDGDLNAYQALLSLGADGVEARIQEGEDQQQVLAWVQRFHQRLTQIFGDDMLDTYVVYEGRILAANPWPEDTGYDHTAAGWYQQAMAAEGQVIFTDIYTDAVSGRDVITVAKKCWDCDAVMAVDIFPENLAVDLEGLPVLERASVYLCDGSNHLIYARSAVDYSDSDFPDYLNRMLRAIDQGYFDRYDSFVTDIEGARRGVYHATTASGWRVIITVPVDAMLANLRQFYLLFGLVMLAWIAGFVVVVWRNLRLDALVSRTSETVQVLSNSYYGLFRINYAQNTYEMIKGSAYARRRLASTGSYDQFLQVIGDVMEPDTNADFRNSFSLASIRDLVAGNIRDYGGDFLGKYETGDRWINVRVLFDETLAPEEAVLCFREVDQDKRRQLQEHKLLEEALANARKSEKAKQAFFNNMSHDMRTPLNAILGLLDLARQHAEQPDKVREYLDKIGYSGRQLLDLVNDILDMSRMEQGKVVLDNQAFDLAQCIQACTDSFKPQAAREHKAYTVTCQIQEAHVMGDASRITQILNNLLSNAFKFTTEGDSVSVSVRQMGGPPTPQYQIVVQDTGVGMSEEFQTQLFEPYARETRFFSRQVVGTGLGMPIVKSLVTQMSGQIYVESKLGQGTTFTITVPFITADAEEESRQQRQQLPAGAFSLEGKRILLAEDNMLNMEIATEVLTMHSLEVRQAWNGREAVEAFQASEPFEIDAILMDMQMPQMDGCEAARTIRALDRPDAATVPIIAVTANAFAEDIAATTAAGMDAHISKPIDFKALCSTLENLLRTPRAPGKDGQPPHP